MTTKPPVFASVKRAYSDAIGAARAMPLLVLALAIVNGGESFVDWVLGSDQVALMRSAIGVAVTILKAPVLIAIFRFVILDEVTRRYGADLSAARFWRFCAWSVALLLMIDISMQVSPVLGVEGDTRTLIEIVLIIAVLAIMVSVTLLFPAIAVDAPGATFRNAVADLKGAFWRASAIIVLVALPVLAAALLAMWVREQDPMVDAAAYGFVNLSLDLLWTVVSARLFLMLANRLQSSA